MAQPKQAKNKQSFKEKLAKSVSNIFQRVEDPTKLKTILAQENDALINKSNSEDISIISSSTPSFSRIQEHDLEAEIKTILSENDKDHLPLVLTKDTEDFSIEGYAQLTARNTHLHEFVAIESEEIIETNREYSYYHNYFYNQEHIDYVGKTDKMEDFILSIKCSELELTCILRTKDGNKIVNDLQLNESINVMYIMKKLNEQIVVKEMKPILHPEASLLIAKYDKEIIKTKFTFGIIYQKFGQTNEKDIFDNQENSFEFDEFLDFIGKRIKLKNFAGFKGGLDIMSDDTGQESIYTNYENSELMFHVSTLLPHSERDSQQIERKRHIGNDRVTIVFQDELTPFSPSMIKSKLLHVFIIIQPIKINEKTFGYQLSVLSRKEVPYFGPFIQKPYSFKNDGMFKNFLLAKLINAEYSSLKAPAFSQFTEKTLRHSLSKLCENLKERTLKFNEGVFNETNLPATNVPRPRQLTINSSINENGEEISPSPSKADSVLKSMVNRLKQRADGNSSRKSFKKSNKSISLDVSEENFDIRKISKDSISSNPDEGNDNNTTEKNQLTEIESNNESNESKGISDVDEKKSYSQSLDNFDDINMLSKFKRTTKKIKKKSERIHQHSSSDKDEENS